MWTDLIFHSIGKRGLRVLVLHIGIVSKVIPLKLFLDIVLSFSADNVVSVAAVFGMSRKAKQKADAEETTDNATTRVA